MTKSSLLSVDFEKHRKITFQNMILTIGFILNTILYIFSHILQKTKITFTQLGDKIIKFNEFIIITNYIEIMK